MAGYKVSYQVLRQQGDKMKEIAKLIDGYTERVSQISSKLGNDEMLAEVRKNLQKLNTQFGESRVVLNTSGELLIKSVESYLGVETRQVKKVDGTRAHNRDFYKNPIVVASAGAGMGAGAGMATGVNAGMNTGANTGINAGANIGANSGNMDSTTTVFHTDNSVHVTNNNNYIDPVVVQEQGFSDAHLSSGITPGVAGLAGVAAGAATAAGAVLGGMQLKKKKDAHKDEYLNKEKDSYKDEDVVMISNPDEYDPEVELLKAIEKVRQLEQEDLLNE